MSPKKPATPAATKPAPKTRTKPRRTRARDPRLPKSGSIKRTFKGREYVLEILGDGFRVGGTHYTSTTAAALAISGYGAVSGPAWWGYAKPKPAMPEAPKPTPPAPPKRKAGRPIAPRRSK